MRWNISKPLVSHNPDMFVRSVIRARGEPVGTRVRFEPSELVIEFDAASQCCDISWGAFRKKNMRPRILVNRTSAPSARWRRGRWLDRLPVVTRSAGDPLVLLDDGEHDRMQHGFPIATDHSMWNAPAGTTPL
jgi:hypothetical protein